MSTTTTTGQWRYQKPRGPQHAINRKWEIVEPLTGGGEQVIVGEHTGIDCLTEKNAKRIVRAVNCHAKLLAALEWCLKDLQELTEDIDPESSIRAASAAIAEAKGNQ